MMIAMQKKWIGNVICFLAAAMFPVVAFAQDQTKQPFYDGRLEGYGKPVTLDAGASALTWLLLIFLGVICLGVLFKNARRSHLD